MIHILALSAATTALAAGILLLRAACRAAPGRRSLPTIGGWVCVAAGFSAWGLTAAADLAVSVAALAFSLVAYLVVATSVRVRAPRPRAGQERHVAEDPSFRPRRPWRFAARVALAGPLSLVFATAACVAIATRTPAAEVDGLIMGGLVAPVGFAGAMAWSLIDQRLARVATGLVVASLLLSGLAIWPR